MTRAYGRSFDGGRLVDAVPHGHWCTTTILSSIRSNGTTAAMTIEDATDTDVFLAYVQAILVPTLRPGDIVVMDNLPPHKATSAVAAIERTGAAAWFLPGDAFAVVIAVMACDGIVEHVAGHVVHDLRKNEPAFVHRSLPKGRERKSYDSNSSSALDFFCRNSCILRLFQHETMSYIGR